MLTVVKRRPDELLAWLATEVGFVTAFSRLHTLPTDCIVRHAERRERSSFESRNRPPPEPTAPTCNEADTSCGRTTAENC
jgi:hypothetical protein